MRCAKGGRGAGVTSDDAARLLRLLDAQRTRFRSGRAAGHAARLRGGGAREVIPEDGPDLSPVVGAGETVEKEIDAVVEVEHGPGQVELFARRRVKLVRLRVEALPEVLAPQHEVRHAEADEAGRDGEQDQRELESDAVLAQREVLLVAAAGEELVEDRHVEDGDDDEGDGGDEQSVDGVQREREVSVRRVARADRLRQAGHHVDAAEHRLVAAQDGADDDDGGDHAARERLRAEALAVRRPADGDVPLDGEQDEQPDGHEAAHVAAVEERVAHAVDVVEVDAPAARPRRQTLVEPVEEDEREEHAHVTDGERH